MLFLLSAAILLAPPLGRSPLAAPFRQSSVVSVAAELASAALPPLAPLLPPVAPSPSPMPSTAALDSPLADCEAYDTEWQQGRARPAVSFDGVQGAMGSIEHNRFLPEWWVPRDPGRLPAVALAVQGSARDLASVLATYGQMMKRGHVSLFLLSFDEPLEMHCETAVASAQSGGGPPHAVCLYGPGTSWTTGRNALARAIFHAELARGKSFKAWIFADQDVATENALSCSGGVGITACDGVGAVAWDAVVGAALLPFSVAHLFTTGWFQKPPLKRRGTSSSLVWLPYDCGDGMLFIFDRQAVPVLFPYIVALDDESWWASQHMMNLILRGCLGGFGGWLPGFSDVNPTHRDYPRGRSLQNELVVLRRRFRDISSWPLLLETDEEAISAEPKNRRYAHGDCTNHQRDWQIFNLPGDDAKSRRWQSSAAFETCARHMTPMFCAFVNNVTQPFREAG